jgi:hypothetical protein
MTESLIGGAYAILSRDYRKRAKAERDAQMRALLVGEAHLVIPLNGGSDTRKGVREHWQDFCARAGIEFENIGGHTLRIGGKP